MRASARITCKYVRSDLHSRYRLYIAVHFDTHAHVMANGERTSRRVASSKMRHAGYARRRGFYRRISIALHSLERVCIGCGRRGRTVRTDEATQTDFPLEPGLVISRRQVGRKDNAKVRRQVKDDMSCLSWRHRDYVLGLIVNVERHINFILFISFWHTYIYI